MRYYDYSPRQLEEQAEKLLMDFDEERLYMPKPIDVYAVIEKCLDVPYDWKYLTPDQTILGATAFQSGYIWAWPEPYYVEGMLPEQVYVEQNTILIDSTLTEQGSNKGRENFTVMHEVFYQVLHKKCFRSLGRNLLHPTYSKTIDGKIMCSDYGLKVCEQQANACAAAFLMPRKLVYETYAQHCERAGYLREHPDYVPQTIKNMARDFSVSKQAMKIHLQVLGCINENEENLIK
jgi:hypothetical protein